MWSIYINEQGIAIMPKNPWVAKFEGNKIYIFPQYQSIYIKRWNDMVTIFTLFDISLIGRDGTGRDGTGREIVTLKSYRKFQFLM